MLRDALGGGHPRGNGAGSSWETKVGERSQGSLLPTFSRGGSSVAGVAKIGTTERSRGPRTDTRTRLAERPDRKMGCSENAGGFQSPRGLGVDFGLRRQRRAESVAGAA